MACDRFKERSRAPRSPTRTQRLKGLRLWTRSRGGIAAKGVSGKDKVRRRGSEGERGNERERARAGKRKREAEQPEKRTVSEVYFISFAAKLPKDFDR